MLSELETMRGTFTLGLITVGNATDFYGVTSANWIVPTLGGQPFNVSITGGGTFAAGQSPFVTHQHMSLDLTITPPPGPWGGAQRFDTTTAFGTRQIPPPVIDMELANNATGCPGIRLRMVSSWHRSDFDADGAVRVPDIMAFLNAWVAGNAFAGFDGVGGIQVADLFEFLDAWFAQG